MTMEILHLTKEDIMDTNERIMAKVLDPGDFYHVRDDATLDFVVYRHQHASSIAEKAAELLFGIATNQIFANGNKRTAIEAAQVFLTGNGISLNLTAKFTTDELEETVIKIATNNMSKNDVIKWLKKALAK